MRLPAAFAVLMLLVAGCAHRQTLPNAADARPEILKALDGHWIMSGDVMGKPVTYTMVAAPTLHGTFTEMHMTDVQVPSEYEARVFIGYDPSSELVISHWMDSFGPTYSIPHATGHIAGNVIEFIFPYKDGPFRDTLTYRPETESWEFVIEASQPEGGWQHFARYEIHRH